MAPRKKQANSVEPISPKSKRQKHSAENIFLPPDISSLTLENVSERVEKCVRQLASPQSDGIKSLITLFSRLEIESVRKSVMPFVRFDSWVNLSEPFRLSLFSENPKLENLFKKQLKNFDPEADSDNSIRWFQAMYFSRLFDWVIAEITKGAILSETVSDVLNLIVVLLAQLPTRRCIRQLLVDKFFVPLLMSSSAIPSERMHLLIRYMHFPLDDFSAEPLSLSQVEANIEKQFLEKMRNCLYRFGLKDIALSLYGIDTETKIEQLIESISDQDLLNQVLAEIFLISEPHKFDRELILRILVDRLITPKNVAKSILRNDPRFPTEKDFNRVVESSRHEVLTTQFLSLPDYVDRNLSLYRQDVFEKLRDAIQDAVPRLDHRIVNGSVQLNGSSRMIAPVNQVEILTVRRDPFSGSPSSVKGEIVIDMKNLLPNVREEWDSLRNGDVLFLLTLKNKEDEEGSDWADGMGIHLIRGCTVLELLDGEGNLVFSAGKSKDNIARIGDKRIARVDFDPITYASDLTESVPLGGFHVVLRLRSTETVFKSVLSSSSAVTLPDWLSDFFLGYGSPEAVLVPKNDAEETPVEDITTRNGLLQIHAPPMVGKGPFLAKIVCTLLREPGEKILIVSKTNETLNQLLDRIDLPGEILKIGGSQDDTYSRTGRINFLLSRRLELLGRVKTLAVAIGLTESVADDFSYNCDNARQFLETKLKPAKEQFDRITESVKTREHALSWLTEKLLINPGAIVGLELLTGLKDSGEDNGKSAKELASIRADRLLNHYEFSYIVNPFKRFRHSNYDEIVAIFSDLERLSPFEILRTVRDRSEFLLTCFSRVICGTSTSVMMNRDNLMSKSDVRFSTVIIDDANQMIDLETFLCLSTNRVASNLKRLILVGDEEQLGPVVSSKFAVTNFGRSLFSRLSDLDAPAIRLTQFTDCRSPFIVGLLDSVYHTGYQLAVTESVPLSPCLVHDAQFVHVGPFMGQGESEPSPNVFQNLGEAEFIVALFMLLRLNNISAESISVLTAYTGQKNLINDVVKAKCDWNPIFGKPRDITTIDQFQGQSNDIVLVSLVRTENPGHMREKKRWTTAIGSARRCLYILGDGARFGPNMDAELGGLLGRFDERPHSLSLKLESGESVEVGSTQLMLDLLQDQVRHHLRKSRI